MKGIVVCPQPRAADAGAEILRRRGTAFDAALAAVPDVPAAPDDEMGVGD